MNDGDNRCSEYVRFVIVLLSSVSSLYPALWSFWYTYDELQWRYYHLSIIGFVSTIWTAFSAVRSWWYLHDNIWQRCYYLIAAIAFISMIWTFVGALSDRWSIKDEYWRRGNCPGSVLSVLSAIVSLLWVFLYSNCMNDDDYKLQRWYYLRTKIAVFTVVVVGSLTFRRWWYFLNNYHLFEWNFLRFAAALAVDGLGFSTVWRWHYEG